jgi:apolipoprotein N-acyltransferase
VDLTRELFSGEPLDLVVWPEASVPVFLQYEPGYRDAVSELARDGGVVLLAGGVAVDRQGQGRDLRFHNSVFALDPQGRFVDRYDKSRLVPFGEYVPFRTLLGFLSGLATGIASGDITPGERPRALRVEGLDPDHALAPLICYEVIYPGLVREAVRAGTDVLVNVTNDAWYGRTSAPHQFLNIAAMRAAEHGLPMVRAANTGVSAIVDARGAIRAATPIFERHVLRSPLPRGRRGGTPYTRFGDWVVWISWGILAYAGGRRVVGRGQRRDPRNGGSAPRPPGEGGGASEASLTSTPSSAE